MWRTKALAKGDKESRKWKWDKLFSNVLLLNQVTVVKHMTTCNNEFAGISIKTNRRLGTGIHKEYLTNYGVGLQLHCKVSWNSLRMFFVCVCEPFATTRLNIMIMNLCKQGGNRMFATDCPTKRAAFMTDMTLRRWSHATAVQFVCDYLHFKLCVITCFSLRLFR